MRSRPSTAGIALPAVILALAASLADWSSPAKAAVSDTAQWTLDGAQLGAELGGAVCTAGDVNGDGYSDVIVGEPAYDGVSAPDGGRARVYYGGPNGVGMTSQWSVTGEANSGFGSAVSTAGDVNGDGYDDVIVGAPDWTNTNTEEGRVFAYYGSASGLSSTAAWQRAGGDDWAHEGSSVSAAGDVNGDGYDDIVIGSPGYTGTLLSQGRAEIVLGGPTGLASVVNRAILGPVAGDSFGSAVSAGGDVNGDRYDDVFIAAVSHGSNNGAVWLYQGSSAGVDANADWSKIGAQSGELFGKSVSRAGDVNGDGYSDALIGAPGYANGQAGEGSTFLYYGSSTGLAANPGATYESNLTDAKQGFLVATAGDVNADGFADLLLSAPGTFGSGQAGQCWIYYGTPAGPTAAAAWNKVGDEAGGDFGSSASTAGDVNGDGRSDLLIGSPFRGGGIFGNLGRAQVFLALADDYTSTAAFTAENNLANADMGSCVGFADVNGDGYTDLLGSSWFYSAGQANEGRVYCWHGGLNGIANPAAWYTDGNQTNAFLGRVIGNAGDVNGDGYEDVVVTAPYFDNGETDEGRAQLYRGSSGGLLTLATWSAEPDRAGTHFGWSAGTAGDVNGDGYSDLVVGGPDWANPDPGEGAASVYLGGAGGLASSPQVQLEADQSGARAGYAVASADVNGDGYSDVLSGAPFFDNGQTDEGAVFVYFGSAGGVGTTASQTLESNSTVAKFGISVASAGDVNSDGYGDVLIGASGYTHGESQEGRVYLYLGSQNGLQSTPALTYEPNVADANLGEWVTSAGDVNADGYADFAVGAPNLGSSHQGRVYVFAGSGTGADPTPLHVRTGTDGRFGSHIAGGGDVDGDGYPDLAVGAPDASNGQTSEGQLYLFQGNRHVSADFGAGSAHVLRMARYDNTNPLALLGKSDASDGFRIRALARSAGGRSRVRVEYNVEPIGLTWRGGTAIGSWLDSGAPIPGQGSRIAISEVVSGLSSNTSYHFRIRYASDSPYFPPTPWFSPVGNGAVETDLRTAPVTSGIPEQVSEVGAVQFLGVSPNPVVGAAQVRFTLTQSEHVRVTLYDVAGRRVAIILEGALDAGPHALEWDARHANGTRLVPGVYFARLEAGAQTARARLVVF